jgi:hypothetical protein
MLELETLSPLTQLQRGDLLVHTEIWSLSPLANSSTP